MFTAMQKLISNIEEKDRRSEDNLVLKLCTQLFQEEELCLRYSDQRMPKHLVKECTLSDEIKELEDKALKAECKSLWNKNRADFCDQRIVECTDDLKQLRSQNALLIQDKRTLEKQNQMLEETIVPLQREIKHLIIKNKQLAVEDKKKEGSSKFSLKTILEALRLRCDDEMIRYNLRSIRNARRGNRIP